MENWDSMEKIYILRSYYLYSLVANCSWTNTLLWEERIQYMFAVTFVCVWNNVTQLQCLMIIFFMWFCSYCSFYISISLSDEERCTYIIQPSLDLSTWALIWYFTTHWWNKASRFYCGLGDFLYASVAWNGVCELFEVRIREKKWDQQIWNDAQPFPC